MSMNEAFDVPTWLSGPFLDLAGHSDKKFRIHRAESFLCTSYRMNVNLLTFGSRRLELPFTVIGLPVSVDRPGYAGDIKALVRHFRGEQGHFLVLNIPPEEDLLDAELEKLPRADTLPSCVFENIFTSWEDYLASLRSAYRRRVRQALERRASFRVASLPCSAYDDHFHELYLQVLRRSRFPLETLGPGFFRGLPGRLTAFYPRGADTEESRRPMAFVSTIEENDRLVFVFGGMDYARRDAHDLYLNMLLAVLELGIESGVGRIDLGQTAESSKCRLGCRLEARRMLAWSDNALLHGMLRLAGNRLGYPAPENDYHPFNRNRGA